MYTKSIMKASFPDDFHQLLLIAMKKKIKQWPTMLINKFEHFLQKTYKIGKTTTILAILRLIYNNI